MITHHSDRQPDGSLRQRLHFNAPVPTLDYTHTVESSADLIHWTPLPPAQVIQSPGATEATDPTAVDAVIRKFLRVNVTQP